MADGTNPSIDIQIGATNAQLRKVIKDSVQALERLESVQKDIDRAGLGSAAKKGAKGVDDLGKSTANALPALTDFSRIIQDAPFGIIGVGNNITQLSTSFGNLSTKAGGAKGAFQALIGSLAGPGGLVFGISTAVTLATLFADELGALFSTTNKLADGFKSVFEEIAASQSEVKALAGIILDLSEDIETRQSALDKLAETYPEYLKGISLEKTAYEDVRTALKAVNDEIIRGARIRALQATIEETLKEDAEDLGEAYAAQQTALNTLRSELRDVINENAALQSVNQDLPLGQQLAQIEELARRYRINQGLLAGLAQATNQYNEATRDLNAEIEDQNASVAGLVSGVQALTSQQLQAQNAGKAFKESLEESFDGEEIELTPEKVTVKKAKEIDAKELFDQIEQQLFQLAQEEAPDFGGAFAAILADQGPGALDLTPEVVVDDSEITALEDLENRIKEVSKRIGDTLQQGIAGSIGNFASAIGQAFAQGDNAARAGGLAILNGFGTILSQLGDILIQAGIASEAFQKLFANPLGGGLGAIAAGIALKAFAGVIAGSIRSIGSGGGSAGGVSTAGGSGSVSTAAPSFAALGEQRVVFEIAGTKLVGVLQNTLGRNNRLTSGSF